MNSFRLGQLSTKWQNNRYFCLLLLSEEISRVDYTRRVIIFVAEILANVSAIVTQDRIPTTYTRFTCKHKLTFETSRSNEFRYAFWRHMSMAIGEICTKCTHMSIFRTSVLPRYVLTNPYRKVLYLTHISAGDLESPFRNCNFYSSLSMRNRNTCDLKNFLRWWDWIIAIALQFQLLKHRFLWSIATVKPGIVCNVVFIKRRWRLCTRGWYPTCKALKIEWSSVLLKKIHERSLCSAWCSIRDQENHS